MNTLNNNNRERIIDPEGVPSSLVPLALCEDYDGCFGNTDEAMRVVENIVEERTSITVEDIQNARAAVEAVLQPFSTVDFINKELSKRGSKLSWTNDIRPYVMERAAQVHHRERLLARGATAVFAVASELAIPEIVVTHGAIAPPYGPMEEWAAIEWQTTKVKMTPQLQDKPLIVTKSSTKAHEFRSWYSKEMNAFLLPSPAWDEPHTPLYARALLHIDDKRSALKDWPTDIPVSAIQYLPERDEEIRQTQLKGSLPEGVPVLRGMKQVAETVRRHYDELA